MEGVSLYRSVYLNKSFKTFQFLWVFGLCKVQAPSILTQPLLSPGWSLGAVRLQYQGVVCLGMEQRKKTRSRGPGWNALKGLGSSHV